MVQPLFERHIHMAISLYPMRTVFVKKLRHMLRCGQDLNCLLVINYTVHINSTTSRFGVVVATCFVRCTLLYSFQHCMTDPAFLVASLYPALITCTQSPSTRLKILSGIPSFAL